VSQFVFSNFEVSERRLSLFCFFLSLDFPIPGFWHADKVPPRQSRALHSIKNTTMLGSFFNTPPAKNDGNENSTPEQARAIEALTDQFTDELEAEKARVLQLRGLLDDKVSESLGIQLALQKEQKEHKSNIETYRQGNIKLRETIKRMESDFAKIQQRIRGLLDEPLDVVVRIIDEIANDIDVALAQNGGDCSRLLLGDSELVNTKEESSDALPSSQKSGWNHTESRELERIMHEDYNDHFTDWRIGYFAKNDILKRARDSIAKHCGNERSIKSVRHKWDFIRKTELIPDKSSWIHEEYANEPWK